MSDIDRTRTIFIKEDIALPRTLSIESEAFLTGWRVVRNLDRYALARKIEGENWNFFYLAGDTRAIVLGRDRSETVRKAVKRVLAKQEGRKFNALELTRVVSRRFLGIPFMRVTAHSRHIQKGVGMVPAKDFVLRTPVAQALRAGLDDGEQPRDGKLTTKQYAVLASSS